MKHIECYARLHFAVHKLKLPESIVQLMVDQYTNTVHPPTLRNLQRGAPTTGQLIHHYFHVWGLKANTIAELMGCSLQNVYNHTSKKVKPYYNEKLENVVKYDTSTVGHGTNLVEIKAVLYDSL